MKFNDNLQNTSQYAIEIIREKWVHKRLRPAGQFNAP